MFWPMDNGSVEMHGPTLYVLNCVEVRQILGGSLSILMSS